MIVITTDHTGIDPDRFTLPGELRPYWEVPARADAGLAAVVAAGLPPPGARDDAFIAGAGPPAVLIQEGGYPVERLGADLTAFLSGPGVIR